MFDSALSEDIWSNKYRYVPRDNRDGAADIDYRATIHRVSLALAEAEKKSERQKWAAQFADAMENFRFMPAERIAVT